MWAARRYLRTFAEHVTAVTGVRVHPVLPDGSVSDALAAHIRESGADLVVMSAHDRGVLSRLLLGSTGESVARAVSVPVLVLRAPAQHPVPLRPEFEHLLIPLDGSVFAEHVVPHAAVLAELMRSEITPISIVEPLLAAAPPGIATGGPPHVFGAEEARFDRPDIAVLERAAARLHVRGLTVRVAVLADRQPARTILRYAPEHSIDLIAMTTHGRGMVPRLVAGSVAEHVLHHSPTAMLVYRPDDAR